MSAETQLERRLAAQPARGSRRWLRLRARVAWRFLTARFSSSLTRRIVVLNLGGLVVLVVGFLLLDQFRADLIEARIQSLTIQADIIAAAISASATGDTNSITIDPDKLLQLAPGESVAPSQSEEDATQFSINPGAGWTLPPSSRHSDPYARPHLRQRRQAPARLRDRFRPAAPWCARICRMRRTGAALPTGSSPACVAFS